MDWIEKKWREWATPYCGGPFPVSVGWEMISSMYAGRAYHNLHHVTGMLRRFDTMQLRNSGQLSEHRRFGLEAAIWFHDIIYNPKAEAGANEHLSGVCAEMFLGSIRKIPDEVISTMWRCIQATQPIDIAWDMNREPEEVKIIVDLDLEGLSSERAVYIDNSVRIRAEFAHLDDRQWWTGRAKFLQTMLDKPDIYHTRAMKLREWAARSNMTAEREYVEARLASSAA